MLRQSPSKKPIGSASYRRRSENTTDRPSIPRASRHRLAPALTPGQQELHQALAERFANIRESLQLSSAELAPEVVGVSREVISALQNVARSPFASVGADNINHLASVFQHALRVQTQQAERPLKQQEVDRLALETVLTDIWYKGVAAETLLDAPTAPTNAGQTGGQILQYLKAQAKTAVLDGPTPLQGDLRALLTDWLERGQIPLKEDDVASLAARYAAMHGLSSAEFSAKAVTVWRQRLMGSGQWANGSSFNLGVWIHGIPPFAFIAEVTSSLPHSGITAQEIYAAVLGHHMAGFIAAGFARANLKVNFAQIEARGELLLGVGQSLARLYDASIELAKTWRSVIERGHLSAAAREQYWQEAKPLRAAIEALPTAVRQQLLSDDAGQFTRYKALGKWLQMNAGGAKTNRDIISGVVHAAQAYLEEARARDAEADPSKRGQSFVTPTSEGLASLGVTYDEQGFYRLAERGEAAYLDLSAAVQVGADQFWDQPADVAALKRLAG